MTTAHDRPEDAPCGIDSLLAMALAFAPRSERPARCPNGSAPCQRRTAARAAGSAGQGAKSAPVAAAPRTAGVDPWFLDVAVIEMIQLRHMLEVATDVLGEVPHIRPDGSRIVELDHVGAVLAAGRVFAAKLEADLEGQVCAWRDLAGGVRQ